MGKPEDIPAPLTEADVRRITRDEIDSWIFKRFARRYETPKPIPQADVERIGKNYLAAFLRDAPLDEMQKAFADLDLPPERRDLIGQAAHDPAYCDHRDITPSSLYAQSRCGRCGAVISTADAREIEKRSRRPCRP